MAQHNKQMRQIAVAILTTMTSGLVFFFFDFHYQQYPRTKANVDVLNSKVKSNQEFLQRIDARTQKIYEILLEKGK